MEWTILLPAAALAAVAVVVAHNVRSRRRAAVHSAEAGRDIAAELARRTVEEDATASRAEAEKLSRIGNKPRF